MSKIIINRVCVALAVLMNSEVCLSLSLQCYVPLHSDNVWLHTMVLKMTCTLESSDQHWWLAGQGPQSY